MDNFTGGYILGFLGNMLVTAIVLLIHLTRDTAKLRSEANLLVDEATVMQRIIEEQNEIKEAHDHKEN